MQTLPSRRFCVLHSVSIASLRDLGALHEGAEGSGVIRHSIVRELDGRIDPDGAADGGPAVAESIILADHLAVG